MMAKCSGTALAHLKTYDFHIFILLELSGAHSTIIVIPRWHPSLKNHGCCIKLSSVLNVMSFLKYLEVDMHYLRIFCSLRRLNSLIIVQACLIHPVPAFSSSTLQLALHAISTCSSKTICCHIVKLRPH